MESAFSQSEMLASPLIPETTPDQGIFLQGTKKKQTFQRVYSSAKKHGLSKWFVIDGESSCGQNMAELSNLVRNVPVTPNNDFKCLHKAKSDTLRNQSFHHPKVIGHLLAPTPPPSKCYRNTGSILIYTILTHSFTKIRLALPNASATHAACVCVHVWGVCCIQAKCMNIHPWVSVFLWL